MEPVLDLAEVVGFRSIEPCDGAATDDTRERIADRLDDFLDRREAIIARVRFDAGRWADHEGSLRAEAVALPAPDTD